MLLKKGFIMNINLNELNYKDKIFIDKKLHYPDELISGNLIKHLPLIEVKGYFSFDEGDNYTANRSVKGTIIITDSYTLEDIPYNFDIEIDDVLPENCINKQNMLDILEFLWENIVLEVPISYTESRVNDLEGTNWQIKN